MGDPKKLFSKVPVKRAWMKYFEDGPPRRNQTTNTVEKLEDFTIETPKPNLPNVSNPPSITPITVLLSTPTTIHTIFGDPKDKLSFAFINPSHPPHSSIKANKSINKAINEHITLSLHAEREENWKEAAENYFEVGKLYESIGKHQNSCKYFEKLLSLVVRLGLKLAQSLAYNRLGVVYYYMGEDCLEKSRSCHISHLQLAEDEAGKFIANYNASVVLNTMGMFSSCLEHLENAFANADVLQDLKAREFILDRMSAMASQLSDSEFAKKVSERRLELLDQSSDFMSVVNTHLSIAESLKPSNDFLTIEDHLKKSFEISEANNNTELKKRSCHKLGEFYLSRNRNDEALIYLRKAMNATKPGEDSTTIRCLLAVAEGNLRFNALLNKE